MLRITPLEGGPEPGLRLEGKLAGPWVAELAAAVAEGEAQGRPPALLDLERVSFIDEAGLELLRTLAQDGCRLEGSNPYVGPLVEELPGGNRESRLRSLPWFGVLFAGLVSASLGAAEPPALQLSLRQSLRLALEQNPQAQQSLISLAQSQEDTRMAEAALLPTVEARAFQQRNKANFDTLLGTPSPHGPDVVGPYSWGQAGLEGRISLFDLSLWERWKAARHGQDAARAQVRTVREGIAALVVGQYLRAQRADESIKACRSRVELAEALEKLALDQQKEGVGTKLDTLRAQVQLQSERQRLIQARTQLRTALVGLRKLLALDPETSLELTDALTSPEAPVFTFQEAYAAGLRERPELEALEARTRAAESQRAAARDLRLPTLDLDASFASTGLRGHPWVPVYQVSVGVRLPLFTGGLVSAKAARAKLELDRAKVERREVEAQVALDVQVAQAELEAARSEVDVTELALRLAEEALLQARHRFEAGVSNNIEVVNAQDELAKASDNRIDALYRLNRSRADLAKAMGRMEPLFAR